MRRNLLIVSMSILALMLAACAAPAEPPQAPADAAATDTPLAVETPPEEIPGGEDDVGEQETEDGAATPSPSAEAVTEGATVYTASFIPMNNETVTDNLVEGSATITVTGDTMTVTITAMGVAPDMRHLQHFHGMVDGSLAVCPSPEADTNTDGVIDLIETEDAAGTTLIPLHDDPASLEGLLAQERFPMASAEGTYTYTQTISLSALEEALQQSDHNIEELALDQRVIFIHSVPEGTELPDTVQSIGDAPPQVTLPVACAQIARQEGMEQAETPSGDAQGEEPATPTPAAEEGATPEAAEEAALTLTTAESEEFGTYITTADGRPVYLFTPDSAQMSACYDDCAAAWPPVTAESMDQVAVGEQLDRSLLSTLERDDGTMQLVYNGHPLYYFVRDEGAQAPQGQDIHSFDGEWYLLTAEGTQLEAEG